MDISKIPHQSLESSKTAAPAPATPGFEPAAQRPSPTCPALGFDILVNLLLALLLLGLGLNFARFAIAKVTGHPYHTGVNWTEGPHAGEEVGYFQLDGDPAWTDAGLFAMGLAAFVEVIIAASAAMLPVVTTRIGVAFGSIATLLAAILNGYICVRFFQHSVTPTLSLCALLFAAWILRDQWLLWKRLAT